MTKSHRNSHRLLLSILCATAIAAVAAPSPAAAPLQVEAKRKPADPAWKTYETRTIAHLSGFTPGAAKVELSKYGGWAAKKTKATGYFRVEKIGDRFWLVDPDGCLFIHVGVCAVRAERSKAVREALAKKFGSPDKWAEATVGLLRDYGFNGTGGWSDAATLRKAARPQPYTLSWNFMGTFGRAKKLTSQQSGHLGYIGDCIPVFHPEFEKFCDDYATSLAATKDDPYLIGHFSDNEMPASRDLLDKFLALDPANPDLAPNRLAAEQWLAQRKGATRTNTDITDEDRRAFLGHVYDRYFAVTTRAIRKHDPNHLCLGPRLHGYSLQSTDIFRAAGKYLDAIAVNYYAAWSPDPKRMAMWAAESGRPVMITEFYAKGADSGYANTTGAGWLVRTQRDRGLFYQNFCLGLLESRSCAGWHWFKYMDNDPADLTTDSSNRDSNKGIVTIGFEPYRALLDVMKELNTNAYAVIQHLDAGK